MRIQDDERNGDDLCSIRDSCRDLRHRDTTGTYELRLGRDLRS